MNRQENIINFLLSRKCISRRCIEKETGIAISTISQVITNNKNLTEENIKKLESALKPYGYRKTVKY